MPLGGSERTRRIVGEVIDTIQKNKEALLDASKVGLEVNPDKTKYMLILL
jgi:hypothetical protein